MWRGSVSGLYALSQNAGRLPLALLILLAGFSYSFLDYWSIGDDHLNFFLTGRAIVHSEEVATRLAEALEVLRDADLDKSGIRSIELRAKNIHSYLIPSAFYAGTAELVEALELAPRDSRYLRHVIVANFLGYWPPFLLAVTVLIAVLRTIDPTLRRATTVALGAMLLALLAFEFRGYLEINGDWPGRLVRALVNPGSAYGLFGIAPRNNFVLLALAIFLLRMDGRYRAAYVVLLLGILFHRQQGGLLLAIVMAVDTIRRPQLFSRPGVLVWPVATVGYFLASETTWDQIGISAPLGVVLVLSAFGLILILASWQRWRVATDRPVSPDHGLLGLGAVFRDDRLFLLLIWMGLFGASIWAVSSGIGGQYFWQLLPGRALMMLQPLMLVSIALWLCRLKINDALSNLSGVALGLRALAACTLVVVVMDSLVRLGFEIPKQARANTGRLTHWQFGLSSRVDDHDEQRLYFAVARSVDQQDRLFRQLLEVTAEPTLDAMVAQDDTALLKRLTGDAHPPPASRRWTGPPGWPSAGFASSLYVAALVWDSRRLAEVILKASAEPPAGPSSALFCDAVWDQIRHTNREILSSLAQVSSPAVLNEPCDRYDYPPICVAARAGDAGVVVSLAKSGVDLGPAGGCDAVGSDAIEVLSQTNVNEDVHNLLTHLAERKAR